MITATATGFSLAAGTYALVPSDWTGSFADPREHARHGDELYVSPGDAPAIVRHEDLQILLIPTGCDERGCPNRGVAVGSDSIVLCGHLAIVAMPEGQLIHRRANPYASHLEAIVPLRVERRAEVRLVDGAIDFSGVEGVHTIDLATPGAFFLEGIMVDMIDDAAADAFGYGSEAFNAKLDEHGFHAELEPVRERLRARTDRDGVALLNRLSGMKDTIAYYAPVSD